MATMLTSIHGRRLGLGHDDELVSNETRITSPCAGATVTVGDEAANARAITIQLQKSDGSDVDEITMVEILIINSADGATLAAPSPSTGLAAGTDGAIMEVVQHNLYLATSEADGDIDLTWTDTGTATAYIAVRLPSGELVFGDQALTNA